MNRIRKILSLVLLLLFSVQTFSYPVLLLRFHHHFDCAGKEKKDCHAKDARSHCTGNCGLAKQVKDSQHSDSESVVKNQAPCPEMPALVQPLLIEPVYKVVHTEYPQRATADCLEGSPLPLFHPPLN